MGSAISKRKKKRPRQKKDAQNVAPQSGHGVLAKSSFDAENTDDADGTDSPSLPARGHYSPIWEEGDSPRNSFSPDDASRARRAVDHVDQGESPILAQVENVVMAMSEEKSWEEDDIALPEQDNVDETPKYSQVDEFVPEDEPTQDTDGANERSERSASSDDEEPEQRAPSSDEEATEGALMPTGETVNSILLGDIDIELPSQVRIVRIFTSSTFTDTFVERNALMERVYPKLKEYCQSVGFDFQVVDMRWGVRDEATADHMTTELCMRELAACQRLSTGPNFVTFLAQKYGYRPFPPKIQASEFEVLLKAVPENSDQSLLTKWFWRDDNICPPAYVLHPITHLLPDYNNQSVSQEARSKASSEWWAAFERMQVVLRQAAEKALSEKQATAKWKYFMSVTEDEITNGILKAKDPKKHCYWFRRTIVDIEEKMTEKNSRNFIDKLGPKIDTEAVSLLADLREEKLPRVLGRNNITQYDIDWAGEGGVSPSDSVAHTKYIDKLCKDFYKTLVGMIDAGIAERKLQDIDDGLVKEICQHSATCQEKSRMFQGRDDVLKSIAKYLSSSRNEPLVVHGPSGCGKTSVLAVAAKRAKAMYPARVLVLRFLGTTSESSTISKVLYSVCCQIKRCLRENITDVPQTYKQLAELLPSLFDKLEQKGAEVVIFLDSLDQLAPDDGALLMKWLPIHLPARVKIVVSTLPGPEYEVFPNLQNKLSSESFVEVPSLPASTATAILDAWLDDASHSLTPVQRKVVMDAFDKSPLPLFLKLLFDEAVRWKSYTPPSETVLQSSIKDAINMLFARLERLHGKLLVSHSLAFVTASKAGLSDAELEDLLSLDDEVLNDVYQYWTPPVRRIPPLLWVRVRSDLGSYIVARGADGVLVNMWYHRQFTETARERYLASPTKSKYHQLMAEYFLGTWSGGVKKPFMNKSEDRDEKDRLVSAQPNIFSKAGSGPTVVYNYRKLNELPYHLIQARQTQVLKDDVLFNFDFLLTKLRGFGFRYVYDDALEAHNAFTGDKDLKTLFEFMKMSARALMQDPYQLAAQLIGRLGNFSSSKSAITLLNQAKAADIPCLYPSVTCFETPGGPIIHSLAGHTQMVNYALVSSDGKRALSVGQDNSLRIWNLESGQQLRCIDHDTSFQMVYPYISDTCAILVGYAQLRFQNLQTEEVYFDEYHTSSYGHTSETTKDGKFFVLLSAEELKVFLITEKKPNLAHTHKHKAETNQTGFVDVVRAGVNQCVYTRGTNTEFYVRNLQDHNYVKKVKVPHPLLAMAYTPRGDRLVVLSSPSAITEAYKKLFMHLYDPQSWNILSKFESKYSHQIIHFTNSHVAQLNNGLEMVWPSIYQVNFWSLETGQERIALKSGYQGSQYKQCCCFGGSSMVIVSMDMSMTAMPVYDLDALSYQVVTDDFQNKTDVEKARETVGTGDREMFLHPSDSSIAISISPIDPVLKVWDLVKQTMVRRVTFQGGLFPMAVRFLDESRLLLWEQSKKAIFVVDYNTGKLLGKTDGRISEMAPSMYSNTWVVIDDKEILTFDEDRKFFKIYSIATGKCVGEIKTGWTKQGLNLLNSKDGGLILAYYLENDYEKSVPISVYDTRAKKKLFDIVRNRPPDLRPEVACLTEDGRLFIFVDMYESQVVVWSIKEQKMVHALKYQASEHMPGTPMAMAASSQGGYVLVFYSSALPDNHGSFRQAFLLVCYEMHTWQLKATLEVKNILSRFFASGNGLTLLTNSQPNADRGKTLDLWDVSEFRSGTIRHVASFMPETDVRFCYLTSDGETCCIGLAGVDGLTFLRRCGSSIVRKVTTPTEDVFVQYTDK